MLYLSTGISNFLGEAGLLFWVLSILIIAVVITAYIRPRFFLNIYNFIFHIINMIKLLVKGLRMRKGISEGNIKDIVRNAGYSYDREQDIFYSNIDSWQRNMGYCRLYDKAAAPLSMIIDCEPIYFEYDNKRWMIEFWKGQYGMTTGGEVGIYYTTGPDLNIPGFFNGTFYYCVEDKDLILMSFTLNKLGKPMFTRIGPHWWLTGFKLGEFSNPSELTMNIFVTLKNEEMRDAFILGLNKAGYKTEELIIRGNTVGVLFNEPRTRQPITRTELTDRLTQRKNQLLCNKFNDITKEHNNSWDKIIAIKRDTPEMLRNVLNIGKTKDLFKDFSRISDYLNN